MKNKNQILSLALLSIFSVLLMVSLSSAITLVKPASSSVVTGTTSLFNVTNTTLPDMTNCTLYAKSTLTANSTWSKVAVAVNSSSNPLIVNVTFTTVAIEDANNYVFNATCVNSSGAKQEALATAVVVDNGKPSPPRSLSPASTTVYSSGSSQTFTATVDNKNTTSCTFTKGLNGGSWSSVAATYSASTCTYTDTSFTDSSDNGNWYWYMTASDETNTSSSGTSILNVAFPGAGGGYVPGYVPGVTSTPEQNQNVLVFIIFIVIAVVIWLIVKKR